MNRLFFLDDSRFSMALLEPTLRDAGWVLTDRPEEAQAALIDPTWHDDCGFLVLAALREHLPLPAVLPAVVLLAQSNSRSRAFLQALSVGWAVKGRLGPDDLVRYINRRLAAAPPTDDNTFGPALAAAVAQALQDDSRPYLRPLLSNLPLKALAESTSVPQALARAAEALVRQFPLVSCHFTHKGDSAEVKAIDAPGYPLGVVSTTWEREVALPVSGAYARLVLATDDRLIGEYLDKTLEALDSGLAVIAGGLDLAASERKVFRVFSRFLPSVVIEDLLRKHSDAALLTGEKRQIVALFSHIRDFSFYVEENDPDDLVRFLNRHFGLYARIIRKHGGFINKYIGDAVFAIFGAPVSHFDNARRALAAAQEIQDELAKMPLMDLVYPPGGYHAGIGLHEGAAIVGNIGSHDSFDYTAIGDTINLAARLESLCKFYHTKILLSQEFGAAVERQGGLDPLRKVDCARVKGKAVPTTFSTPGSGGEAFDTAYRKALGMFRLGNWVTALEFLEQALVLNPDDFLCALYRDRCREFLLQPPVAWDGVVTLKTK